MSYGTLLLHLDGATQSPALVEVACGLAKAHGSHVIGLTATGNAWFEGSLAAGMLSGREREEAVAAASALARERADEFEAAARRLGLASFEVAIDDRDAPSAIADRSLYVDLVALGQPERGRPDPTWSAADFERSLSACAAPVLAIPGAASTRLPGRSILVAWAAEPPCARALSGALPLLRLAEQVEVVHVDSPLDPLVESTAPEVLQRVADRLSRHGVGVTLAQDLSGTDPCAQIVDHVRRVGADLLVMGAWGHPRWAQRLLGGVTRSMLASLPVPVLLAH